MVRPDSVDEHSGFLGEGGQFRGGEAGGDDRRRGAG